MRGSAGGKAMALISRERAVKVYLENPNRCRECDQKILPRDTEKISTLRRKRFCNHSCAAKNSNRLGGQGRRRGPMKMEFRKCEVCGEQYQPKRFPGGGLDTRKKCDDCKIHIIPLIKRTKSQHFDLSGTGIDNKAKGRATIGDHARRIFKESGKPEICIVCGYDKGIHVHHIKPVQDFDKDTEIATINALENLVALCPNHHWEAHHGFLEPSDLR